MASSAFSSRHSVSCWLSCFPNCKHPTLISFYHKFKSFTPKIKHDLNKRLTIIQTMCLAHTQACPQIHLFTAVPLEICQILPANIHSMHTQYTYSCRNNAQLWNNENCSLPLLCDALSSVFGVYYKIVAEGLSHSHSPLLGSSLKPSETKEWNKFIIHSAWKFHNSVEWILRTNKLNLISTTKKSNHIAF